MKQPYKLYLGIWHRNQHCYLWRAQIRRAPIFLYSLTLTVADAASKSCAGIAGAQDPGVLTVQCKGNTHFESLCINEI